jgi:hypothetical protein
MTQFISATCHCISLLTDCFILRRNQPELRLDQISAFSSRSQNGSLDGSCVRVIFEPPVCDGESCTAQHFCCC